jgi:O-antigen ligase
VLRNFRLHGWSFFRGMIYFLVLVLIAGLVLRFVAPDKTIMGGRFHGIFGNPNGLAIFCFLLFLLTAVVNSIEPGLFTWKERVFLFGMIILSLIMSGSRGALAAVVIYLVFNRFFSYSPFLGFVVLVAVVLISEVIGRNLAVLVMALGLEEFFRLRTLEGGSGRYFAWEFAWEKIQDYLVFGGGFANDETIMRRNYAYLERMGHQGGVHNSYLSMWFNVGFIGLIFYFRSFLLLFIKASKLAPMSLGVMFSVLFSINYESWLVGSLNPYTIMLLIVMTVLSEEEIAGSVEARLAEQREEEDGEVPGVAGPTFEPALR